MNDIIVQTRDILSSIGFLPIIIVNTAITMYFYWRESRIMGKNQNSIFDGFVLSALFMVFWGRLTYIFTNPSDYEGLVWSIFPYERYPDGFYLFRLLPWRYFRIWDGEFLFTGLFVGFIIAAFVYSTIIKRWRWREMMASVISTAALYLGLLLLVFGFIIDDRSVLNQGVVLVIFTLAYYVIAKLLLRLHGNVKLWEKLNYYLIFLYSIVVSIYIPSTLLNSEITLWDRYNLYAFIVFSILSHIIYIIDVLRKDVKIETIYKSRSVLVTKNQPIKL